MSEKQEKLIIDIVQSAYMHMPNCTPENEPVFREGLTNDIEYLLNQKYASDKAAIRELVEAMQLMIDDLEWMKCEMPQFFEQNRYDFDRLNKANDLIAKYKES